MIYAIHFYPALRRLRYLRQVSNRRLPPCSGDTTVKLSNDISSTAGWVPIANYLPKSDSTYDVSFQDAEDPQFREDHFYPRKGLLFIDCRYQISSCKRQATNGGNKGDQRLLQYTNQEVTLFPHRQFSGILFDSPDTHYTIRPDQKRESRLVAAMHAWPWLTNRVLEYENNTKKPFLLGCPILRRKSQDF